MAVGSASLLLSVSVSILIIVGAQQAGDEAAALLAFKAAAFSGGHDNNLLPSWNSSSAGGFCSWEGVRCGARHRRVVALSLPSSGLTGTLSPAIGNLTFLRTLNLTSNGFQGGIPASIGGLVRLQTLDLSHNTFSGALPANLSSCVSLLFLTLSSNRLHGRIPVELGRKLTVLQKLSLGNNSFTGDIPVSLANISSLNFLDLSANQFEGPIPPELGTIGGLRFLYLYLNNLSGALPHSLYNLSMLQALSVGNNSLSGTIPANIGNMFPNIENLNFAGNKFRGTIPPSLTNLSAITNLILSVNSFSGRVPLTLGRLKGLVYLYLNDNHLEANDREGWEFITALANCSQLQQLFLSDNSFSGELPSSIANLSTTLQYLHLEDNRISGVIASNIGNLVGLKVLRMANTSISGVIPESIGRLENLVELYLFKTRLSGLIPSSLGNLTRLNTLLLFKGNLEGPIPASLGNLKNLFILDISRNRLNGSIPREVLKLPALTYYLGLSYNSLSGSLPTEVGSLTNLNGLFLSGNQLSGNIPANIGNCKSLEWLWLDQNSFEGSVPQSFENLKGLAVLNLTMNKISGSILDALCTIGGLQELYLAHNNFSGLIPTCLQNLASLSKLDLSFNNLQGEVPKRGVFANGMNLSIDGNDELCGGTPQFHLAPCSTFAAEKKKKHLSNPLMITLISISALVFSVSVVVPIQLIHKKLRKRRESQLISTTEERYERVSYYALSNGTNGFSEANLLGQGSYGMVYKCTLHEQGATVAVKVFSTQQSRTSRSFVAECEALRRVRHRCLIKIITCCSSINHQGQEFKALVFEFMPNGSLNGWLHPESGTLAQSNTLSLEQRIHIAVDIIDALDYLHNHCQPSIIHCDLKPSNILLTEDMSARVGDFGISRILPESASNTLQNSNSTTGIRGTVGYIAPEYGEGSSVSTQGDVYSLGILLLEMFTGRSPTDDMFNDSLDLHKFSENALPEKIWDIIDPTVWMHTDAYNSTIRSGIQNCLVSVVSLGVSCSKKQPKDRIPIKDAAIEMHAIRDSYLKFAKSLLVEHGGVATTHSDFPQQ
ncbi:putative LRR receptor-like serine/threonine-protein kinase [Dichanthelium oligosanthes]|uniref:Receptor kinase-like protein Xa21 n=1 Tax=Dichanthelium oligosanthes TaxID=888268 RepID=A0A1E5W788_9POAL|nr:putative LRR receptor-like serine/threonine-protein kinase [Dichanthelium oligosanthes]